MPKQVLDVGQCGFDHGSIARMVERNFAARVLSADGPDDALAVLRREFCDLVLVNRQLDADGSDGMEVLRRLKAAADLASIPVMLVSNYPEAQQAATAAGAEPGFGKRDLDNPETRRKLARFLE